MEYGKQIQKQKTWFWLLTVTSEVAGSSPVVPANFFSQYQNPFADAMQDLISVNYLARLNP